MSLESIASLKSPAIIVASLLRTIVVMKRLKIALELVQIHAW